MPEGVEIRWTAKCLEKQFVGLDLYMVQSHGKREVYNWEIFKQGMCTEIGSKGKVLYFRFGKLYLVCQFGLTGYFSTHKGQNNLRYTLNFLDKTLYYYDAVNFGRIEILNQSGFILKMNGLGIDIFNQKEFTQSALNSLIDRRGSTNICVFLLDQKLLAGIGNYAKCEVLYHSNISPYRTMGSLSKNEINKLFTSIHFVIFSCYFAGFSNTREKEYYNIFYNLNCSIDNIANDDILAQLVKPSPYVFQVYGKTIDTVGNTVLRMETPDHRTTYWVKENQS
jgi:formamidopyrimidine-DNA glycosylase